MTRDPKSRKDVHAATTCPTPNVWLLAMHFTDRLFNLIKLGHIF